MVLSGSCDAHHATAPHPEGRGAASAFRDAISVQGLAPQDIDWVCAHGSGTLVSDAAEAQAVTDVFGEAGPPVSGLKGAFVIADAEQLPFRSLDVR